MSKECLVWGSWSLDTLLNFNTYFWLEEGLVFSFQKACASPLTSPINFMSEQGSLSVKDQKSIGPHVLRLSRLLEYFLRVLIFHFMR
jgi:hypothetical protein